QWPGLRGRLRPRQLTGRPAADDLPLQVIAPAMIWAHERRPGDAAVLLQNARAAVTAGVVEGRDRTVIAAQHEDRVMPDLVGAVVTALGDFRLAGEEQPVAAKDEFKPGLVERLVSEESARQGNAGVAFRHQRSHMLGKIHRWGAPRVFRSQYLSMACAERSRPDPESLKPP